MIIVHQNIPMGYTDPHCCPQCLVGAVVIMPTRCLKLLQVLQHGVHLLGLGLVSHTMLQFIHSIHCHLARHLGVVVGEKSVLVLH